MLPQYLGSCSGASKVGIHINFFVLLGAGAMFVVVLGFAYARSSANGGAMIGGTPTSNLMKAASPSSAANLVKYTAPGSKSSFSNPPKTTAAALPFGWAKYFDDAGEPYYFNTSTGESSWDVPK